MPTEIRDDVEEAEEAMHTLRDAAMILEDLAETTDEIRGETIPDDDASNRMEDSLVEASEMCQTVATGIMVTLIQEGHVPTFDDEDDDGTVDGDPTSAFM